MNSLNNRPQEEIIQPKTYTTLENATSRIIYHFKDTNAVHAFRIITQLINDDFTNYAEAPEIQKIILTCLESINPQDYNTESFNAILEYLLEELRPLVMKQLGVIAANTKNPNQINHTPEAQLVAILLQQDNPTNSDLRHLYLGITSALPDINAANQFFHDLLSQIMGDEKAIESTEKSIAMGILYQSPTTGVMHHALPNIELTLRAVSTNISIAQRCLAIGDRSGAREAIERGIKIINRAKIQRNKKRHSELTALLETLKALRSQQLHSIRTPKKSSHIGKITAAIGIAAFTAIVTSTVNQCIPEETVPMTTTDKTPLPSTPANSYTNATIDKNIEITPPTPPVDDISFTLAEADTTIPPTAQINNDPSFTIEDTHTLTIAHKGLIPALKETYGLTALQLGKLYRHPSIFKGTQSFANFLKIIAEANIEQFASVDLNSMPALIKQFEERDTLNLPQLIIDLIEEVKNNEDFPLAIPQTDEQIEAIQQKQHKATSKEISQDTSIETDAGWFDINIDPVSPIENIFAQTEQEIQDTIASTPLNLATENTTTTAETDEEWNTFDATARMDEITQASTPPAIPKAKGFWSKVKEKAKSWFG
ncbi:hypothetical protein COV81_04070 [Candidatus Peregrinibacteria bacterium CG11_big_fil_rev_8_21_14_0_20_41_10]|nr:MAG: hypothetical protein COV81_04070 [Candidatus Peregrinibacteria bacterium CG11_big_fil_rev_8_21_14_0_20_41_10]PJC38341.1 MAG: hypothetical protein CO045_00785 [Candidatus Peregrinibacteria bacterium CG_4_9_14_0_2_um_filter_41_14]